MKFGKYLASRQLELPEYSGYFIDYKALKKLIKQLAGSNHENNLSMDEMQRTLKENKASFFFRVERELDKVNQFYLEKQADLAVNVDLLLRKKSELLSKEYSSASAMRHSISYLNLYQNFKKIHQDLSRLQQFIELNETGFSKVVKKWDKRSKSHTKELFIQTAVSVQPVFHKNDINELSDSVTHSLFELESIMDGDYSAVANYSSNNTSSVRGISRTTPSAEPHPPALPQDEIDQVYASFVTIATVNDPDVKLLARWIENVKSQSTSVERLFTRVLTLAVGNLEISDQFFRQFLEMINWEIDWVVVSRDNFNQTLLHQCCAIAPPVSDQHIVINNGVKVVNHGEQVKHSRKFMVEYIMKNVPEDKLRQLLVVKDYNGRMCIHYAAHARRLDLMELILPVFPREFVDDLDKDSMSALLVAIKHGEFPFVKLLVEHGADCFPRSSDTKLQYLPVNYACKYGNYPILEFLLCQTKDPEKINQQDVEGLFPLHVVSRSGHFRLIKLLMPFAGEANINRRDGLNKWPPLFYAASEGHSKTAEELVACGAQLDVVDDDGYNVLYYCVVQGHIDILNKLLTYAPFCNQRNSHPGASMSLDILEDPDSEDATSLEKTDGIPDLKLPPPILPLRRYGHNFLEQKVLIEVIFPRDRSDFIRLFDSSTNLKPGRITLVSNNLESIPRNVLLPVGEERTSVFQADVDALADFRIDFEIFPKFGTRLIAKTSALEFAQGNSFGEVHLPLFDLRLKNIGELRLNYQVIYPFSGSLLETSKFDTYWKSSTNFIKNRQSLKLNAAGVLSPNNFLSPPMPKKDGEMVVDVPVTAPPSSVVTATSLSGEYLRIKVCLLNDGTPVVCPHWSISITESIELYLPNLKLEQLTSITNNLFDYERVLRDLSAMGADDIGLIKKLLRIIYLPLTTVLNVVHPQINLNLEFVFPSQYEMNQLPFVSNISQQLNSFIDLTLTSVFDHVRSQVEANHPTRSIIFLSSNSLVCKILNWKQPNFPVFLLMNGISYSAKTHQFVSRTTNGLPWSEHLHDPRRSVSGDAPQISEVAYAQELSIRSIKEAVNFTMANNLIGLVCSIHLLDLVPKLVPLIRSKGLLLVASSDYIGGDDENEEAQIQMELDAYTRTDVNGLRFDDVLSFKGDICM
ncbi:hypothetical protein DIURU_005796 [Diutina rugosa]|uniref:SPX domain-containing protein n=1 Tax=Diutina rugosa TaxID=5481 RepID=A0A642UBW5_DIURU|nr:uncharacterized protein DIURU_005796 [Diutina rugosa]KAA8896424.1 hypothetical protein DIURU_005796 [Diutina rugosa]